MSRIGVLFLQSQSFLGADSTLHVQLMRHLDRRAVEVHVALTTEPTPHPVSGSARAIAEIPDLKVRLTYFGPSIHGANNLVRFKRSLAGLKLLVSLTRLAAYMRRNNIRIVHGTEKPRDALYGV